MLRIKSIELLGFKSFKDKTQLPFNGGVTTIVGPNGSGKSNIFDALLWCLGVDSARSLRAKRNSDLIFAGSKSAHPLNVAQVKIVFSVNGREALIDSPDNGGNDTEQNEILVSRRLYRDEATEFYLNSETITLRDLIRFFEEHNLTDSSIITIGQGEVNGHNFSSPTEIRKWLESVTGVSHLVSRTGRIGERLKSVSQTILRLEDLLRENMALYGDLREDALKARKYLGFLAQWKRLKTQEILRELDSHFNSVSASSKELAKDESELNSLRRTRVRMEDEIERGEKERVSKEAELRQILDSEKRILEEEAVNRAEISKKEENLSNIMRRIEEEGRVIQKDLELADKLREEIQNMRDVQEKTRSELSGYESLGSQITISFEEVSGESEHTQQELKVLRAENLEMIREDLRLKNEIVGLRQKIEQENRETLSLKEELSSIHSKRFLFENERSELEVSITALNRALEAERIRKSELESKEAELRRSVLETDSGIQSLLLEKNSLEVRAEANNTPRMADYDFRNPQADIRHAGSKDLRNVGEYVNYAQMVDPALKALIHDLLDHLVLDDETAQELLANTLNSDVDELRVLFTSKCDGEVSSLSLFSELDGKEILRRSLETYYGRVEVRSSLHEAMEIVKSGECDTAVTKDGRFLVRPGVILYWRDLASSKKTAEAEEIMNRLGEVVESLSTFKSNLVDLQRALDTLRKRLEESNTVLDATQSKLSGSEMRLGIIENSLKEISVKEKVVSGELEGLCSRRQKLETDLQALQRESEEAQALLTKSAERIIVLNSQQNDQKDLIKQKTDKLAIARERAIVLREKLKYESTRLEEKELELQEISDRNLARETDLEEFRKESVRLSDRLDHLQADADGLTVELKRLANQAERAYADKGEIEARTSRLQQEVKNTYSAEEKLIERSLRIKAAAENFFLRLAQLVSDSEEALGRRIYDLLLTPREEITRKEISAGLKELKLEMDSLQDVNLHAVEKWEEMRERVEKLENGVEEGKYALDQLSQLKERLDQRISRKYTTRLNKIEENFERYFKILFGDGRAAFKYLEDDSSLIRPVELDVELPGKGKRSLRSFSGGEQTLLYLALFLAAHNVCSPGFCFLDEVDATLDDANIVRFCNLIRALSSSLQFVLVTHNKRTMELSDSLIGIVNQPKGVSHALPVTLREASEYANPPFSRVKGTQAEILEAAG